MRSKLSHEREDEIAELAEIVADEYCPETVVCPLAILKATGVAYSVCAYGEKTFDGLLECKNGKFFIFCNRDRGNTPYTAKGRFTLAHELGHYFIPEHRQALLSGIPHHQSKCGIFDGHQVTEELEADLFAASLLMPRARFTAAFKKATAELTPLATILELKEKFEVSILSTAINCLRLDSRIVAMVKWTADGQIDWKRISDEYFATHQIRSCKKLSSAELPKGSATRSAFQKEAEMGRQETVSTVATWFDHISMRGNLNYVLREESIRLGEYGLLTLLSIHPNF